MSELSYYSLRLTPYPNTEEKVDYCRNRIEEFILGMEAQSFVCGQEYENNHHFHLVFSVSSKNKNEEKLWINSFRDNLYLSFDVPKEKKGNPTYSLELVRNLDRALSYAVKDGDYFSSEDWAETVEIAYANSKPKKRSMKSSIAYIAERFEKNEINEDQVHYELCMSRGDLMIPLNLKWVEEMILSLNCRKDPEYARELRRQQKLRVAILK